MQTERVINLVIVAVWQTLAMKTCYFVLLAPAFAMDCSTTIQTVIALDRFLHLFFPFWLLKFCPNTFHIFKLKQNYFN
jgi:riboflavin transporter FmnP